MKLKYVLPPFEPSFERFARGIRLDLIEDLTSEAEEFFELCQRTLQPVGVYRCCNLDSWQAVGSESAVTIEGHTFQGLALSALEGYQVVLPYVASCGAQMESLDLSAFDMLAFYWLDIIKNQALATVRKAMIAEIKHTYNLENLSSINPGSGFPQRWPVQDIRTIFSLLELDDSFEVTLTESSLMIPNKSLAGFFFAADFSNCSQCLRQDCSNRNGASYE